MKLSEAKERVEAIRSVRGDDEQAHALEDRLRADALRYLALVAPAELGELARIALTTDEIDFARWCA